MTLDQARVGSVVRILSLPQGQHRAQFIRLGLSEGSRVRCAQRFRLGPLVLQCHRQEIALGHQLARCIEVREEPA
ncbi:MAG: ferrous iron transport protein A [Armatimonadetes bacterium]|jgi:Fe2+ transport system protein FeoA|nr:ferrous iron transport protein A [Armatimonadota bacterium]